MNLGIIEGYIEVKGQYPILVTALHGFGSSLFKDVIASIRKLLKKYCKLYGVCPTSKYYSAVDVYTWEIAFKAAMAENAWMILPTLSKVDKPETLDIPDYNLNKYYASSTPLWRRVSELVSKGKIRVIIDIHGMRNTRKWPDICISTAGYKTVSKKLVQRIAEYLESTGYSVRVDYPFSGGAFIRYFGNPPNTEAFALELKRSIRYFGSEIPLVIARIIKITKEYIVYNSG